MSFSVNALTTAGLALIAQATSSNPIVWIGAVASVNAYTAIEISTLEDPSNGAWGVQGGIIVAASATDTVARIIAGFTNRPSETTIKTVGVVCRLASQPDSAAIVVAAVSDSTAAIRIPPTTEPACRIEVDVNVSISASDTVTVTSSTAGSAMLSDLDRLVSCHKAGQPTVGERQGIYGIKDFRDDIYVGDDTGVSIRLHGEERGHYGFGDIVVKNAENGHQATLTFHLDGPSRIEVDADFCPAANVVYNLGDPSLKWGTLYVDSIGSQTDFLSGIHTAALNIQSEEMANLLHIYGEGSSGEAHITGVEDVYLEAEQSIHIFSQDDMVVTSNSIVEVLCHGFHVNSVVRATAFEGLLPYAKESNSQYHPEIPVGSIVWIWFGSAYSATLGQAVTAASFTPATHLAVIKSDGAWGEGLDVLPTGSTFVPLVAKATGTAQAVPCMRKA